MVMTGLSHVTARNEMSIPYIFKRNLLTLMIVQMSFGLEGLDNRGLVYR